MKKDKGSKLSSKGESTKQPSLTESKTDAHHANIDPKNLKAELRKALLDYRKKRPSLSLRAIARNSGVNRYFLNKLLEESKAKDSSHLDLNQVLKFSNFLSHLDVAGDLFNPLSPSASGEEAKSGFGNRSNEVKEFENHFSNCNLYDKNVFMTLLLANTKTGTTTKQVQDLLGVAGVRELTSLLNAQILHKKDESICLSSNRGFNPPQDIEKLHLSHLVEHFVSQKHSQRANHLSIQCESVSKLTLEKIKAIYQEAEEKVKNLISMDDSKGDQHFFSVSCMDSFSSIGDLERQESEKTQI